MKYAEQKIIDGVRVIWRIQNDYLWNYRQITDQRTLHFLADRLIKGTFQSVAFEDLKDPGKCHPSFAVAGTVVNRADREGYTLLVLEHEGKTLQVRLDPALLVEVHLHPHYSAPTDGGRVDLYQELLHLVGLHKARVLVEGPLYRTASGGLTVLAKTFILRGPGSLKPRSTTKLRPGT